MILLGLLVTTPMFLNAQFWNYSAPEKLEGTVNTDAEENVPVFSNDSSALYFTRTFDMNNKGGSDDQDVWVTYQDDKGGYSNGERVKDVNNKMNNAVLGLSSDGKRMYLLDSYEGKKDEKKGIAVATKTSSGWSSPKSLDIPDLDIDGEFYGFHVNEKEDVIILSYAGPSTLGEEDLYVITKNGSSWSAPVHMGSSINSTGFEISPFLSKGQDTLFFSSNGFGGEGDADIFYSVKQGSWTSWSAPVNLGNTINSPKFDAYFIHNGEQAYWSTNRESMYSDIWMLNILKPVPLEIECKAVAASEYGKEDGAVELTVISGNGSYTYEWSNGATTEDLTGLGAGDYSVIVTDVAGKEMQATCKVTVPEPDPVDLTQVVEINEIKFDLDKSNIRPDAAKELDKIVEILNDNPKMVIELGSHTDCRGSESYNMRLSDRRAKSSAAYIKKRITNPSRVTSKGYGESKLLNDCACEGDVESTCSEEQHQENRRTEFKIIEIGSENLIIKNNSNNSFEN